MLPALLTDPLPLALLTLALFAAGLYQYTLPWGAYKRIHDLKVRTLPLVDRYTKLFVVSNKDAPDDDAEHIATIDDDVREVWTALIESQRSKSLVNLLLNLVGFGRSGTVSSPHLINSVKRLPDGALSAAHAVFIHEDGSQTEAYLFDAEDGGTHVYAHYETGFTDAEKHLSDGQEDGDPRGVVRDALGVDS